MVWLDEIFVTTLVALKNEADNKNGEKLENNHLTL